MEGDRKILGSGLRLGGLGDTLRKLGHSRLGAVENGRSGFTNDCLSNIIYSVTLSTERGDQSKDKGAIGK